MNVLVHDILHNIFVYHRAQSLQALSMSGTGPDDALVESPLGQYLNFDEYSHSDFNALYKQINKAHPTNVDVHMCSKEVAALPCVHRVYGMLMSYAGAAMALKRLHGNEHQTSRLISMTVAHDVKTDTVNYASTCEALPGLAMYVVLTSHNTEQFFNPLSQRTVGDTSSTMMRGQTRNNMTDVSYFDSTPYMSHRKALFDLFGVYSLRVPTMSSSKIESALPVNYENSRRGLRWMNQSTLETVRGSSKMLWEIQGAYYTFLMNRTRVRSSHPLLESPHEWEYFQGMGHAGHMDFVDLAPSYRKSYTKELFFRLPVLYTATSYLVNKGGNTPSAFEGSGPMGTGPTMANAGQAFGLFRQYLATASEGEVADVSAAI